MNLTRIDNLTTRCPMLGHLVPFHYCRDDSGSLPCRKILDCWHERFDIHAYLKNIFSEEEILLITAPPKPKLQQIIEIAQKAIEKKG